MQQETTRRTAFGGMVAGVAAVVATVVAAAEAEAARVAAEADGSAMPIIDTHQHLWDFSLFRPPWLQGAPAINKSTTMADYLKATAGLNVVKTVYMEVDVAPEDQMREAEWVEGVCARGDTPMKAGVAPAGQASRASKRMCAASMRWRTSAVSGRCCTGRPTPKAPA